MSASELTMAASPEVSVLVRQMLAHPDGLPWSLQGFGMLRCDLMGREWRLHVWDRRFRTQEVATIHDHPWDLESLVLSGSITNVIYEDKGFPVSSNYGTHYRNVIQPGREAVELERPRLVELTELSRTTYGPGEGYAQTAVEIHDTIYVTGTVTLVRRTNRQTQDGTGDKARVYWPKGGLDHFVDATPQDATPEKVTTICEVALAMWNEQVEYEKAAS